MLADALQRVELLTVAMTSREALGSPGATSASPLAVFAWPPGHRPTLEAETYAQQVGVLHVQWDGAQAQVGPFVTRGHGPCPGCLSATGPAGTAPRRPRAGSLALAAWASSLAALQAQAVLHHHTSDLIGASLAWQLANPGLQVIDWARRHDCPVRGCAQP